MSRDSNRARPHPGIHAPGPENFTILHHTGANKAELGGHGHELNRHRCPCPRHGHGRGMDTKFLEKRGVDMDMAMKKSVKRGVDMDMAMKKSVKKNPGRG